MTDFNRNLIKYCSVSRPKVGGDVCQVLPLALELGSLPIRSSSSANIMFTGFEYEKGSSNHHIITNGMGNIQYAFPIPMPFLSLKDM